MLRKFFILSTLFAAASLQAAFTIEEIDGKYTIREEDKPVLTYNHSIVQPPPGYMDTIKAEKNVGQRDYLLKYAVPRSNYIHPFYDLNGNIITKDYSLDHAHHRGIYWGFPEVQYKGETADLHALQKVFARPNGEVEYKMNKQTVELAVVHLWKWDDKEPIVNEQAELTVFPKDGKSRKIMLKLKMEALVDGVTIARRGMKHYGGLSIRMQPLNEWKASAEGTDVDSPAWVSAQWKDPAGGGSTELTVFEKKTNPCYPAQHSNIPNINWLQPAFPKSGTRYPLEKGKKLELNYELWLHKPNDAAAKKAAWSEFQAK